MLVWMVLFAGPVPAEIVNRVIATVDGEPVTAHELERYARERADVGIQPDKILDALITEKMLEREAGAQGIAAKPEEVDAYVKAIKDRNRMDDARFGEALKAEGITMEEYRGRVKADIERTQLMNREIRSRVTISPEDVERYYQAHRDDYGLAERATVRDIFLPLEAGADEAVLGRVRAKAEEVRALAVAGRRFEDLAEQFGEGPGARKGGLLGTFRRGEMAQPLDEIAFALKPGETSQVIATPRGFHILRVDERTGEGHRPLDEVREEIREKLYAEALESRFEAWLTRDLRERHHVELLDPIR